MPAVARVVDLDFPLHKTVQKGKTLDHSLFIPIRKGKLDI